MIRAHLLGGITCLVLAGAARHDVLFIAAKQADIHGGQSQRPLSSPQLSSASSMWFCSSPSSRVRKETSP